jgi:hypothetical protein
VIGDIVRHRIPHRRGTRRGGLGDRRDSRQFVVVDIHKLGRIARRGKRPGNHHGHGLAEKPHAVAHQWRTQRLGDLDAARALHLGRQAVVAYTVRVEVNGREHGDHIAGLLRRRRVDRSDARVRMRRAHERDVACAIDRYIGRIEAPALGQAKVLAPVHHAAVLDVLHCIVRD